MIERLKLTILVEDSSRSENKGLQAEHGLSVLIEIPEQKCSLLMDTGRSPNTLLHNMKILRTDLNKINIVVLSHGHYDHTGGLVGLLKQLNKPIPVVAHPEIFKPKFKIDPYLKYIGLPCKASEIETWSGKLVLARNPVKIMNDVSTTGEIKRITSYEKVLGFWTVENEKFVKDLMRDDQALVLKIKSKGLAVISGCAHSGIVNTVNQAKRLMKTEKVYAILGGFHLIGASKERINSTIEDLDKINPDFLYPCHCTGSKAIKEMTKTFGKRCKPLKTGDTLEL